MQVPIHRMRLAAKFILAAAIAAPAHAQSTASGTLPITANVVCPLLLVVRQPLNFGRLLTSTTKTIAPNAATSGHFEIIGQGGSSVTVTLSMPALLDPPAGMGLPVTGWNYVASNTPGLGGSPVSFNSGTSDPINLSFATFDGSTTIYFGIGATVTASATQPTTTYTGAGQITAAYADL